MRYPAREDGSKVVAIYDTGIIVQAALSPFGVAERAFQWAESGLVEAIVNHRLRWEYEYVLYRLQEEGDFPQLAEPGVIEAQLSRVDAVMFLLSNAPRQVRYARDPNDEQTVDFALYTQAYYVVARYKDLLVLNQEAVFRRVCSRTRVVNPVEFVEEMERRGQAVQYPSAI